MASMLDYEKGTKMTSCKLEFDPKSDKWKRTAYWLQKDLEDLNTLKPFLKEAYRILKSNISSQRQSVFTSFYKTHDEYTGRKSIVEGSTCSNGESITDVVKKAAKSRCPNTKPYDIDDHVIGIFAELFVNGLLDIPFKDFFKHFEDGIRESRDEFDIMSGVTHELV